MTILDIPEDWTPLSDLARQHGLSSADVLELAEHNADVQLTGSGEEMLVCRLKP